MITPYLPTVVVAVVIHHQDRSKWCMYDCDRPERLLLIRLRAMGPLYRNQVKCLYVHAYDTFFLPSRDREEQRQLR